MAITARDVRSVEFTERLRGYNPDSVDQFLRLVAQRFDEMEAEIATLEERSTKAESRLADSGDEDVIRRTLILAQRAADLAIAEARERADALIEEAREQGQRILEDAESAAKQRIEAASGELREEVQRLSGEKAALIGVLTDLHARLDRERNDALRMYESTVEWLRAGAVEREPLASGPADRTTPAESGPAEADHTPFGGPTGDMGIEAADAGASDLGAGSEASADEASTAAAEPTHEMPDMDHLGEVAHQAGDDAYSQDGHGPWDQDAEGTPTAKLMPGDPNVTTILPVVNLDGSAQQSDGSPEGEPTRAIDLSEVSADYD